MKECNKIILIVDDDSDICSMLKDYLEEHCDEFRVAVYVAHDGEEGIEIMKKMLPNLVLLDINMPKKNGIEVLEEMKMDEKLSGVFVVIITSDWDKAREAMRIRADHIMGKPIKFDSLLGVVRNILASDNARC